MKHIKHNLIALSVVATLTACSGGGDATAPEETTTGGTTGGSTTTMPTEPTPAAEPTTGYGYVTNPAGGNYGIQCAKDYATGLIWEGKNPNPSHPQGIGRTYTNFDNTSLAQVPDPLPGFPSNLRYPTASDINAATNTIGYKNAINANALCGFSDWRLPTWAELNALGKLSSHMPDFPETSSGTYWSSDALSIESAHKGVVNRPDAPGGNKEFRWATFGLRLVRSSR